MPIIARQPVSPSPSLGPIVDSGEDLKARVISYYEQALIDYKLVWHNQNNYALHFGYYDESTVTHAEALQNANRMLADVVGIREDDVVLDAGCGLGGSAFWLATHRGASVVGITAVASHAAWAAQSARRRRLEDRVRFEVGDYMATGFSEGSFDVVWALESSCHAGDKLSLYREMFRVLRPGGRLVIADFVKSDRPFSDRDERVVRDWLDGWSIPGILTADEHWRYTTGAGFENVGVRDFTCYTFRSLRRLYKLSWLGVPIDFLLYRLGLRSSVQHGNVVGSRRQFQALMRGCWFYGVVTGRKPSRYTTTSAGISP